MTNREILRNWVVESLIDLGGEGSIVQIAKHIWENHKSDLKEMGSLFYTWQYDMRWSSTYLKKEGKLDIIRLSNNQSKWRLI
jgi:hypothetical protein